MVDPVATPLINVGLALTSMLLNAAQQSEAAAIASEARDPISLLAQSLLGRRGTRKDIERRISKDLTSRMHDMNERCSREGIDPDRLANPCAEVEDILRAIDDHARLLEQAVHDPDAVRALFEEQARSSRIQIDERLVPYFDELIKAVVDQYIDYAERSPNYLHVAAKQSLKNDKELGESAAKILDAVDDVRHMVGRSASSDSNPSRVFFGSRPEVVAEDCFIPRGEQERLNALISNPTRRRTVLVGMRGCGKTQLASTLAQQCEDAHWSLVAWVNASSTESITSDLVELAKELKKELKIETSDQPTPKTIIRRLFNRLKSADPSDRLIVFDNVENIDDLRGLLPSGKGLRIVATTTNNAGWEHHDWKTIKVGVFDRSESIDYLLTVTRCDDHDAADALAQRLGDLPLAIAQAAGTARHKDLSLARYLKRLDSRGEELDIHHNFGDEYTDDVATVLWMAVEAAVDSMKNGTKQMARRQLGALALLAESGVPTRWLDPTVEQLDDDESPDTQRDTDEDAHDTLTELIRRSIVQQSTDGSTTTLHRLQAQVLRESWNDKERDQANESAAKLLGSVDIDKFHRIDTASRRRETLDLIEQLRAIGEQTQSQDVFNFEELSLSLSRAFIHARDVGLLFEACTLEIPVEAICKRLGMDHPVSLVQLNDLAYAYQNAGRVAQAISLYEQVLPNSSRILGMDHPTTLASRNNLASAYQEAGQLIEAIAAYKQLVMDSTQFLGTDHPYTLTSCNNLGHAYLEAGQLAEAIAAYEKVLTDRTRILGPSHPDTLLSRNNLAYAYTEAGRLGEAVTLYTQLVVDSTQLLGTDHPKTLMARDNLASALCSAGDVAEAIFQYEQLSNDSARILGENHPDTLTSLHNLACTYLKADRFNDAISLFERVITCRTRVFGEGHPDTLAALHNLALTYSEIGDFENAIPLSEQVLSNTIRIFGAKHPKTLTSRSNVASAYLKTGRLAEAIPMFKQVLTESIRILGTDHPDVLTTKNNLAYAYQEAGHLAEAISMYEQILIDSTQILDTDHPDIMDARQNLAYAYQSAGRYTDAFTLCEQNLAESTRILGTNNPKTITARNSLAYAYARGGRHSEAASLFVQVFEERARVLGVDHPDTLASHHNLVVTYLAPTDPVTAFEMLSDIFCDCMRVLGPKHPLTVSVQENLALTTLKLAQQEHDPHADERGTQD